MSFSKFMVAMKVKYDCSERIDSDTTSKNDEMDPG